uniref:Uncharacterized protein n=1 Tax=Octopus bimaculoides TaxID=37653 RepID=A0A0L8FPK8_OCTBM
MSGIQNQCIFLSLETPHRLRTRLPYMVAIKKKKSQMGLSSSLIISYDIIL